QTLERAAPRIRMQGRGGVDLRFERARKRGKRRRVRTPRAWRRHHAEPQLANDLLGGFRVLLGVSRIEARERQAAGLGFVVVGADAVLLPQRRLIGSRRWRGPRGMMRDGGLGRRRLCSPSQREARHDDDDGGGSKVLHFFAIQYTAFDGLLSPVPDALYGQWLSPEVTDTARR